MAFYSQLKLPPLRLTVTQHSKSVSKVLFRGVGRPLDPSAPQESGNEVNSSLAGGADVDIPALDLDLPIPEVPVESEPTHHELQCKSHDKGWEQLRSKLLCVSVECSEMPLEQVCLFCDEEATIRCQDCGSQVFYCEHCWCNCHKKTNLFHVPEKWEVCAIATGLSLFIFQLKATQLSILCT